MPGNNPVSLGDVNVMRSPGRAPDSTPIFRTWLSQRNGFSVSLTTSGFRETAVAASTRNNGATAMASATAACAPDPTRCAPEVNMRCMFMNLSIWDQLMQGAAALCRSGRVANIAKHCPILLRVPHQLGRLKAEAQMARDFDIERHCLAQANCLVEQLVAVSINFKPCLHVVLSRVRKPEHTLQPFPDSTEVVFHKSRSVRIRVNRNRPRIHDTVHLRTSTVERVVVAGWQYIFVGQVDHVDARDRCLNWRCFGRTCRDTTVQVVQVHPNHYAAALVADRCSRERLAPSVVRNLCVGHRGAVPQVGNRHAERKAAAKLIAVAHVYRLLTRAAEHHVMRQAEIDPVDAAAPGFAHSPRPDTTQLISNAVQEFRAGDPDALESMMALCGNRMRSAARRYVNSPADVDDAVQEAWIAFTRKADSIDDPRAAGRWLSTASARAALAIAKRQKRAFSEMRHDPADVFAAEDDDRLQRYERCTAVRCAVGRLSGDEQQLAWLLFDETLTYEQMSAQSGRPVGSLGPTRSRILRKLRRDPGIADHAQYTSGERYALSA